MTVTVENVAAAQTKAKAKATSELSTSHPSNDHCNCYTSITDPKRTLTFQNIAQVYDDQISRDEMVMGLPLLRRSLLYFNATGDVLEVGAGTGRNLDYYPGCVHKVVLTDTSDQMLLQARDKLKDYSTINKAKFELFVADAQHITEYYPESSFDTVVDTFGLCSFDDPVAVLKELQRVCKPNGKILLLEHGRSKSWKGLTNYLDKNAERHATNWGCVWNRDLDGILEEAGLEVEKLSAWHFGTTYYVVCKPSLKVKQEKKEVRKVSNGFEANDAAGAGAGAAASSNEKGGRLNTIWNTILRR